MLTYMIEYRNMKKGLIAAGLLVSLSGTAQDVSTYTPGTMGEGVVYYLPKTEIELQVTATKVVYTPGEFCQYLSYRESTCDKGCRYGQKTY